MKRMLAAIALLCMAWSCTALASGTISLSEQDLTATVASQQKQIDGLTATVRDLTAQLQAHTAVLNAIVEAVPSLGSVATSPADGRFRVLEARRVVVKDEQGNDRIRLNMDQQGPEVELLRADGQLSAYINGFDSGGNVWIPAPGEASKPASGLPLTSETWLPVKEAYTALYATAHLNSDDGLTDRLSRQSCNVYTSASSAGAAPIWTVYASTTTQAAWDTYMGDGRFSVSDAEVRSAYQEAGTVLAEELAGCGIKGDVTIHLSIRGHEVGLFRKGLFARGAAQPTVVSR